MKQYKILIISDIKNPRFIEDMYIAKSFKKDGHIVKVLGIGYKKEYDAKFDIIIRRNTWEENKLETLYYTIRNEMLVRRIYDYSIPAINVVGLQETDLEYMPKLLRKRIPNIYPTITDIDELFLIMKDWSTEKELIIRERQQYLAKKNPSITLKVEDIGKYFKDVEHVIQPNIEYKSQVQVHCIGNKIMYAFEYSPTKYNKFTNEKQIIISEKDKKVINKILKVSNLEYGMQRLDFVRLKNDDLLLYEIKDTNVHMNMEKLDFEKREEVINEFKKNIYKFLKLNDEDKRFKIYGRI